MNATTSNSVIQFDNNAVFYDKALATPRSVELYNISYKQGNLIMNCTSLINWTRTNSLLNASQIGVLTQDLDYKKRIKSNVTNNWNCTATVLIGHSHSKTCDQVKSVTESSASGNYSSSLATPVYSCSGSYLTVPINNIEYSSEGHTIDIGYLGDTICDSWEATDSTDCLSSDDTGSGSGSIEEENPIDTNQTIPPKDVKKDKDKRRNIAIGIGVTSALVVALGSIYVIGKKSGE